MDVFSFWVIFLSSINVNLSCTQFDGCCIVLCVLGSEYSCFITDYCMIVFCTSRRVGKENWCNKHSYQKKRKRIEYLGSTSDFASCL
jgi:hypothetical protein